MIATELLTELDHYARGWPDAGLIVGFAHSTEFVEANDPDRFGFLDYCLGNGGEGVGLYRLSRENNGTLEMALLPEYEDDLAAKKYLEVLAASFLENVETLKKEKS